MPATHALEKEITPMPTSIRVKCKGSWSEQAACSYTCGVAWGEHDRDHNIHIALLRCQLYIYQNAFLQGYSHGHRSEFPQYYPHDRY